MKTIARLLWSLPLLAAVTLTSCSSKEEDEKESVNVAGLDADLHFAAIPAGALSFTIESNVAWSITKADLDWLTIDPMHGSAKDGTQTVTLTARQNETEEALSGSFTVTAGSFTKKVAVSQDAAKVTPTFATNGLKDNALAFAAEERAAKTFQVSSNKDWKATLSGLDWADVTPLEGDKNRSATLTVTPKAANTGAERKGTISFAYGADAPYVVTVSQEAFTATLTLDPTTLTADAAGILEKATVTVTANAAWTAKSSAAFVTLDKSSGAAGTTAVTVTVAANDKTEARSAVVTFENGAKAELTVNQAAKPAETLTVSATELSYEVEGAAQTVNVTSNAAWTVTASESWLTVAPASGNGNGTVTVTTAANTGASRTATVTIAINDDLKVTIAVSQKGAASDKYIDLATEPVVWCADDQAWNMENNPEFPGPTSDATGFVESAARHGIPVLKPMNGADKGAVANFIDGKGSDVDYSTVSKGKFLFVAAGSSGSFGDKGGDIGFRQPWIDDQWVFTVPAQAIKAGQSIHFDFTFLGTTACPKFWAAEVKVGSEWVMMKTLCANNNENTSTESTGTLAPGAASNVILLTPQRTNTHYDCTYDVTAEIPTGDLQVRLRVVDPSVNIGGKAVTAPTASNTVRFVGWNQESRSIQEGHGPTIYVK